jgi:hypothetical protein
MKRRVSAGVLAVALLLTGCSAPQQQYISASSYGMYFALPIAWTGVPNAQMKTAQSGWTDDAGNVFRQSVVWQGAWTAQASNADEVFAAAAPSKPVVFAFVRDLITVEQQGIGANLNLALRDVIIPASSLLDAGADVQVDSERQGAFRGIHQVATFTTGGKLQTTEVVSMLAPSKNRVYVLMVRCTETCFSDNIGTINHIFDSLTFKEPRGQ